MSAEDTLRMIGEFVDSHSSTIENALSNQSRRMNEAADLALSQGAEGYAKAFHDDARTTWDALKGLRALFEELAEQRQDESAHQG